ncbi:hypothetical protein [Aeromonas veronii]|uniref:hypothetical protein n=1 Tax=Aeromonas veronii TaxID=654 RepID=UPI003D1C7A10
MKIKKVYGVGYNDLNQPTTNESGKIEHFYSTWTAMFRRCYCQKYQAAHPTYQGCTVDPEWHSLSNFKRWYDAQGDVVGMSLDKDILTGSKVYGPDQCLFVPQWLNLFILERSEGLTGAPYDKTHKTYAPKIERRSLGYYKTPEEAHRVWKAAKLEVVHRRKDEFDKVDKRIYPALGKRYEIAP